MLSGLLRIDLRVCEAAALYEAKKGVPVASLGDREVERMTSALEGPHPAERARLDSMSLMTRQDVDQYSQHDIHIYTDGSKIQGNLGAALSLWSGGIEIKSMKLVLPKYCTLYQAELLAINRSTKFILGHNTKSFGIFSDSMAIIQTVKNPNSLHPLAVEARDTLRTISSQDKDVTLFWVKAQAGLEGNERADQLAKEA